jgi:hypothetical protein
VLALWVAAPLLGGRKKHKVPTVPTAPGKPGTAAKTRIVNGHDVKPGADLKGADLSGGDLHDCDLTGADLRGADCRGARFCGAILTGADLRNARMFEADLSGVVGADLTGAELHPFFELLPRARVGNLAFLRTRMPSDTGPGRIPSALACSPGGTLLWMSGTGTPLRLITPTGARFRFTDGVDQVLGMGKDAKDRLWCFGAQGTHVLDLRLLDQARGYNSFPCHGFSPLFKEPPAAIAPGTKGEIWVSSPGTLTTLSLNKGPLACETWELNQEVMASAQACAAPTPQGDHLVLVDPERARVLSNRIGEEEWTVTELKPGSRPRRLAQGAGGRMAFTQTEPAAIVQVDLKAGHVLTRPLPELEGKREPWALALGPDGNLWYTDPAAGRVGRLTAEDGNIKEFQLPQGMRPLEIVPGHDGRMFFTLEGRHWIGSVVAVPRGAGAEEEPPAPVGHAAPEKRAEWRALLEKRIQRAERRQQARLAREARRQAPPAKESQEEKAGSPEAAPEQKQEGGGEINPLERLAAMGVNLAPAVIRHILAEHGAGAKGHKSQFHARFSHREGLEKLLAKGLEECGAVAKVRVSDFEGRHFTVCERKDVGWRNSWGRQVATDRFVVVTANYWQGDAVEYDIITAYPVSETW